jgi:hypothetical protein
MTAIGTEPAPPLRLLVPVGFLCLGVYLWFTALALEIYVLAPIAVWCVVVAVVPALRLLRHR